MEYVLSDRNSTGIEAHWFKRSIETLEQAIEAACEYPEAHYILEYRDYPSGGVVPTGRSWTINQQSNGDNNT